MSKRSAEAMAENIVEFNSADGEGADQGRSYTAEDFAFIKKADDKIVRVATLCDLLRVIDLDAIPYGEGDLRTNISHSLREFGALLSREALDASSDLMFGKMRLGKE